MQVLILAGILALAAAQTTTIDPSVLIDIFGTPPTPPTVPATRQPLENVNNSLDPTALEILFGKPTATPNSGGPSIENVAWGTRNVNADGHPTVKPSLLVEIFGTPQTPESSRYTHENLNSTRDAQGTRNVKVEGIPTIKPSLLVDVFGTPPVQNSSRQTQDNESLKVLYGNKSEQGVPTIKPSLLVDIFGTPPGQNSSRQTHDNESLKEPYGNMSEQGVPTIKPSLLVDVFGTPPVQNSSRQTHDNESLKEPYGNRSEQGVPTIKPSLLVDVFGTPPTTNSSRQTQQVPQGTRSVETVSTIKPSLLVDVFGTPPTNNSSRQGYGDRNSKKDTQGTRNVNVEGLPPIDPSMLIDIFGTTSTTEKSSKKTFEDITVKPTEEPSTFVDKDGEKCQCVPYYLCDKNNVGVDANNASVTGWGELDIRFGDTNSVDRKCQESVEVCCTIPKDTSELPKPKPTPKPQPDPAKGCGYRNPRGLGVTITGGSGLESQFGEFPWVVALLDNYNTSYAGVGVLIHPQVVMTGAHIAAKYGPGALRIRAGEWDTQTTKEYYPYEERVVESTVIHENFQPKSLKNDIALLRLDVPLEISQHINVICMPDYEEVFDSSKNCVANGWGKSHFGQANRYAVILKKVEQDMVPYSRCNTLLKRTRLGHNFKLHNSFVCAGGEAGKDTCQGDGGAPLACPIGNNRYKLTGLVAWGIGCGQQDVPAVYTNVPMFRHWVDDKMAAWGLEATSYRIPE